MKIQLGSEPGTNGEAAIVLLVEVVDLMVRKHVLDAEVVKQLVTRAEGHLPKMNNKRVNETRTLLAGLKETV